MKIIVANKFTDKLNNGLQYLDMATGPNVNILDPGYDENALKKMPGNAGAMPKVPSPSDTPAPVASSPSDTMTADQIRSTLRDPTRMHPDELARVESNLQALWGKTLDELTDSEAQQLVRDNGLTDKFASTRKWILVYASQ